MTNEDVRNRIQNAIGVHDDLLTMVKNGNSDDMAMMIQSHLKILWHGEDNSAVDSERRNHNEDNSAVDSDRSKKERKTEEDMGR